jgi:hypothetical protein
MDLARPIASYPSVAAWAEGLRRQWGGDPLAEDPEKLASLAAFCRFVGKDPDELLAFCFLRRKATDERFASVQRREALLARLKEFEVASGLRGVAARRLRSHALSFLSHNGVLI